jgi:hypothetical protein
MDYEQEVAMVATYLVIELAVAHLHGMLDALHAR